MLNYRGYIDNIYNAILREYYILYPIIVSYFPFRHVERVDLLF